MEMLDVGIYCCRIPRKGFSATAITLDGWRDLGRRGTFGKVINRTVGEHDAVGVSKRCG